MVRPGDPKNGLTTVQTELKLLQIDLVIQVFNKLFIYSIFTFFFKLGREISRISFNCVAWNGLGFLVYLLTFNF